MHMIYRKGNLVLQGHGKGFVKDLYELTTAFSRSRLFSFSANRGFRAHIGHSFWRSLDSQFNHFNSTTNERERSGQPGHGTDVIPALDLMSLSGR